MSTGCLHSSKIEYANDSHLVLAQPAMAASVPITLFIRVAILITVFILFPVLILIVLLVAPLPVRLGK